MTPRRLTTCLSGRRSRQLSSDVSRRPATGQRPLWTPLNRAKNLFRVGYYLPSITETVAIAVVWRWVLNSRYGILKHALEIFGIQAPNWLGDPRWAMPAIIMMAVWKGLGHNALIFLAGLQSIPSTVYEAARIDGANGWTQFRYVTLPLLAPTTFFVGIMTLIGYLQLFAEPYTMTDGGPVENLLLIAGLVCMAAPFVWMLSTSLKGTKDIFRYPPQWIPKEPTLDNYLELFKTINIARPFSNTVITAISITALSLLVCSMAG